MNATLPVLYILLWGPFGYWLFTSDHLVDDFVRLVMLALMVLLGAALVQLYKLQANYSAMRVALFGHNGRGGLYHFVFTHHRILKGLVAEAQREELEEMEQMMYSPFVKAED